MNAPDPPTQPRVSQQPVGIPVDGTRMEGMLAIPPQPRGVILFAHGSGSGRFSPRNLYVAQRLHRARLATLLIDLLDEEEAADRARVFDIELLARRVLAASHWLEQNPATETLSQGYFGASTGAGAALVAASTRPPQLAAVVSRGGRPDLAGGALGEVEVATLLIVGGDDAEVLTLNRLALANLAGPKQLVVIPGATHLFPEPGALEEVARLASLWFVQHLKPVASLS